MIKLDCTKDMHTHPFEKTRTKEGMESFVQVAIERRLKTLAFTDHAPMEGSLNACHTLSLDEMETYYVVAKALQEKYRTKIRILVGIEADYHPGNLRMIENLKKTYSFDIVLGSIHMHVPPYATEVGHLDDAQLVQYAFDRTSEMVESGLVDGVAHLDYFRRALHLRHSQYDPLLWRAAYEHVYAKMADHAVFLEVNTSGLAKDFHSVLPTQEALRWSEPYGLTYTMASDAHYPEDIAYMFGAIHDKGAL
ncbi:MAG: histidinol-phosphatase HisJ family protein [Sphaerochaetaceae bacterium]|jgi:histidinol-phosphatase (PHP family)